MGAVMGILSWRAFASISGHHMYPSKLSSYFAGLLFATQGAGTETTWLSSYGSCTEVYHRRTIPLYHRAISRSIGQIYNSSKHTKAGSMRTPLYLRHYQPQSSESMVAHLTVV